MELHDINGIIVQYVTKLTLTELYYFTEITLHQ